MKVIFTKDHRRMIVCGGYGICARTKVSSVQRIGHIKHTSTLKLMMYVVAMEFVQGTKLVM